MKIKKISILLILQLTLIIRKAKLRSTINKEENNKKYFSDILKNKEKSYLFNNILEVCPYNNCLNDYNEYSEYDFDEYKYCLKCSDKKKKKKKNFFNKMNY